MTISETLGHTQRREVVMTRILMAIVMSVSAVLALGVLIAPWLKSSLDEANRGRTNRLPHIDRWA